MTPLPAPGPAHRSARSRRVAATAVATTIVTVVAAACAALAPVLLAGRAAAAEAPPPGALLVVDGAVDAPPALATGDGAAAVDLALLESLPRVTVATRTPWSEGVQRFEGARLSALLDAVGARGHRVLATGIDDYAAELDPDEVARYPIIVAWLHDGAPMTVRTLGPLRVVLPFDAHPELANAAGEARSVWQLVRLTVLD